MEILSFLFLPVLCLLWLVQGIQRLRHPQRFARKTPPTAPAPASDGTTEAPPSIPEPPPSDGAVRRVQLGGILRLVAVGLLWWRCGFGVAWANDRVSTLEPANDPGVENAVLERANKFLVDRRIVGLSIAAVAEGKEAIVGVGRTSILDQVPPNGDALFEIGSISKVFTGTLLALDVEAGKLSLDQTIPKSLPADYTVPAEFKDVTLKKLATHSAGFPRMPGRLISPWRIAMMFANADVHPGYTESEFRADLADAKPIFPPGTKAEYSNFSAALLGHILAKTHQTEYDALMQTRIAEPLGMKDTSVIVPPDRAARMAPGFSKVRRFGPVLIGYPAPFTTMQSHLAGAGGIRSSARDMLRFVKANMKPDDSPLGKSLRRSHQELFKDAEGYAFGMHWIRRSRAGKPTIVWHNGGTTGFRSFCGFTEDGRTGVVVLCNASVDVDALGMGLLADLATLAK